MPDLQHTLQGNDLGFLKMVAGLWGIEMTAPDAYTALPVLIKSLDDQYTFPEILATLPENAREALFVLLDGDGRHPWAQFVRQFGELRPFGAARRDRERPDLKPTSVTEILWYRALIGKAFFSQSSEPQEFAYLPDEFIPYLQPLHRSTPLPFGRAASPAEYAVPLPASDAVLDTTCTLLAALRLGMDVTHLPGWNSPIDPYHLKLLLITTGLLDSKGIPLPDATRSFLEKPRGAALTDLANAWLDSCTFNELFLLPGLVFEGGWLNDALLARQKVIEFSSTLPAGTWWSLNAFVAAVKERQPDFQRLAGDYDSWFIRRAADDQYLRGFSSWDAVDGAMLRWMITCPMHWLGFLDLASPSENQPATAFRLSNLWQGQPPIRFHPEKGQIHLNAEGILTVNQQVPRAVRYQVARFGEWLEGKENAHAYRLTPTTLEKARQQGLRTSHLLTLLRKFAIQPLPPMLMQALEHWEQFGTQAVVERITLLRLTNPEMLPVLRSHKASRYLGEQLSPNLIVIKSGGENAIRKALAELGYLAGWQMES
jgi:hypothetical protein